MQTSSSHNGVHTKLPFRTQVKIEKNSGTFLITFNGATFFQSGPQILFDVYSRNSAISKCISTFLLGDAFCGIGFEEL